LIAADGLSALVALSIRPISVPSLRSLLRPLNIPARIFKGAIQYNIPARIFKGAFQCLLIQKRRIQLLLLQSLLIPLNIPARIFKRRIQLQRAPGIRERPLIVRRVLGRPR
jgi:hypothetical protein